MAGAFQTIYCFVKKLHSSMTAGKRYDVASRIIGRLAATGKRDEMVEIVRTFTGYSKETCEEYVDFFQEQQRHTITKA